MSHQIHYKDHQYIGVIIGPYMIDKNPAKTKGDCFVFHVHNNQTYKLNYSVTSVQSIPQRDIKEIVSI